jgi:prevent-host-death family protein
MMVAHASVTEAKRSFSELLNRAAFGQERIVITSHDNPKAAVISYEDLRRLEWLEDVMAAIEGIEEFEAGETLDWKEVRAEIVG